MAHNLAIQNKNIFFFLHEASNLANQLPVSKHSGAISHPVPKKDYKNVVWPQEGHPAAKNS